LTVSRAATRKQSNRQAQTTNTAEHSLTPSVRHNSAVLGLPSNTKTWVNLYDVEGEDFYQPTAIIVEANSIKNKWVKGAEILITSHTRIWNEHQQRTIEKVSKASEAGYVKLELNTPIIRPTTYKEYPEYAVEVALLSRNIVFEGGQDNNSRHGGHFMVRNTPNILQSIVGVDVRNFGQQGFLGAYPIHFHFCGDVFGSVVAKNTIRQSFQRCIVVHGTNKLRVEDNIAFDTSGHCYMVGEDGMETNNRFIRNLGAQTKIPTDIIPNDGFNGKETDSEPATFWLPNPTNDMIGNIAAGSESSGFWIEPVLRGTRAHLYPDYDPSFEPIGIWDQNVAHSNYAPNTGAIVSTIASKRHVHPVLSVLVSLMLATLFLLQTGGCSDVCIESVPHSEHTSHLQTV